MNWSHIGIVGVLILELHVEDIVVIPDRRHGALFLHPYNLIIILALEIEDHLLLAWRRCWAPGRCVDFGRIHAEKWHLLSRELIEVELIVVENWVLIMG